MQNPESPLGQLAQSVYHILLIIRCLFMSIVSFAEAVWLRNECIVGQEAKKVWLSCTKFSEGWLRGRYKTNGVSALCKGICACCIDLLQCGSYLALCEADLSSTEFRTKLRTPSFSCYTRLQSRKLFGTYRWCVIAGRARFDTRSVCIGFLVDRVALGHVLLRVFRIFPVSIMLHTRVFFVHHRHYLLVAIDSIME